MKTCKKCKLMANEYTVVVNAGKSVCLCEFCFSHYSNAPDNSTKLKDFITMTKKEWIDRNIKLAKERRDKGETVWKDKEFIE